MDIIITESQLKYIIKETFNVDYTFDRFKPTFDPKYGPPKIFFNNSVKVDGNKDSETEIYKFTRKDGEEYQFDSRDISIASNGTPFIKLSDFEIEYPEEGDKIRGMIELEKKNNETKVNSVDTNEIIDNPLSDINQAYFKKNISGVPQTILDSIKSVYPSNWGKIDEEGCKTGEGLLDIETVGVGQRWSIMNYFDTNPKVIYILTNEFLNDHNNFTINDFKNWIQRESKKLFSINKVNDRYDVSTRGMKDSYKTYNQKTVDYIGYADRNDLILFPNKQYSTQENGRKVIHYVDPIENV